MFSPPKLMTIIAPLLTIMLWSTVCDAQQAEYNRRMAAMQKARERAQSAQLQAPQQASQIRLASAEQGFDYAAPPAPPEQISRVPRRMQAVRQTAPQRVAQLPRQQTTQRQTSSRPTQTRQSGSHRVASRNGAPAARTAQLYEGVIIDGGSPIVNGCSCGGAGCAACGMVGSYETIDGGYIEDGYIDGGCCDTGCDSCIGDGGYFDDPCCGRGGCPPGPCWLSGFGSILYNGEYFAGAQGFQGTLFNRPGVGTDLVNDCNFGFNEGVNLGIPLCNLTCGLLSGQVGFRAVQTNFNGSDATNLERNQYFITAGLYRRVDYGIQAGVVADILYDEWYTETETAQVRADLGWVYPGGTSFGFRYAESIQDDTTAGSYDGNNFTNLVSSSEDYYRFYARKEACAGGYGEMYFGWTDNNQTIFGMETDLPVTETLAIQSGFTYYLDDDPLPANSGRLGGNLGDAWNIGMGIVWRPAGRATYKSYNRPLFNVADNGSFLINRQ